MIFWIGGGAFHVDIAVGQRPGCTGRFELSCVISSSPDQTELYPALFCVYQNSYTHLSNTGRVWFDDCNDQTECVTPSGPIMFCILLPYSSYLLFYISIPFSFIPGPSLPLPPVLPACVITCPNVLHLCLIVSPPLCI